MKREELIEELAWKLTAAGSSIRADALMGDIDAYVAAECDELRAEITRLQAGRDVEQKMLRNALPQLAALERVRKLAEEWRYKGEFGWGPWQEGHGPDQEGWILDNASAGLRRAIEDGESDEA